MTGVELTTIEASTLAGQVARAASSGGRMQMVYAWRPAPDRLELRYLASREAGRPFAMWALNPEGDETPSMANISPLLGWYEREITDLHGLKFTGHPEPRPLILHMAAETSRPPLDPRFPEEERLRLGKDIGALPEMENPDVQLLPWGPVRAGVVELAEFDFFYIGEHILHLQPQLFFKHRGIEKRFEGMAVETGVVLAERVSGVGSLAHALAFCQAVEAASVCVVPGRARLLRLLLAELERLYNHLHYLGHLAETTTLKVAAAEGKLLEERVKQLNARLTGSRFLRGALTPGGLRRDLDPSGWLLNDLVGLREETRAYTAHLERAGTYLDRLITTGVLKRQVAMDQGATGPVERASGLDRDLRRDHPYAAYDELAPTVPTRTAGDAHARAEVRMAEIDASFELIVRVLGRLEPGEVRAPCTPRPGGEGLGWAESPRGTLFHAVHLDEGGRLARVKIKSPSFSNWRAFPFTVHDSNMMDYAINEASFGLTISGCDR